MYSPFFCKLSIYCFFSAAKKPIGYVSELLSAYSVKFNFTPKEVSRISGIFISSLHKCRKYFSLPAIISSQMWLLSFIFTPGNINFVDSSDCGNVHCAIGSWIKNVFCRKGWSLLMSWLAERHFALLGVLM